MAIKDILVHVDNGSHCAARIRTAIELARSSDAHVTGVYIDVGVEIPVSLEVPMTASGALMAQLEAEQVERRTQAETTFNDEVEKSGVPWTFHVVETSFGHRAETVSSLSSLGRYSDMMVIGQRDPDEYDGNRADMVDNLVFDAGRPVLVMPYAGSHDVVGRRVLVAWNNSREAARAVSDALPILEKADHVFVLQVNPKKVDNPEGPLPGVDIAVHLARHGVDAEVTTMEADDVSVGDLILSRASDFSVDLIVMGAYGHSRLRELVLGGATRHLVRHMTVPVLMSH